MNLNYEQAHKFVAKNRFVSWEGWDVVLFCPNRRAYYKKDGAFKYGKWGFVKKISCNNNGIWEIPNKKVSMY